MQAETLSALVVVGNTFDSDSDCSFLVSACALVQDLLFGGNDDDYAAFQQGGRGARVALADACARQFLACQAAGHSTADGTAKVFSTCHLETLDTALVKAKRRRGNHSNNRHVLPLKMLATRQR